MNEHGGYYFEAGEITKLIIFGGELFKMTMPMVISRNIG